MVKVEMYHAPSIAIEEGFKVVQWKSHCVPFDTVGEGIKTVNLEAYQTPSCFAEEGSEMMEVDVDRSMDVGKTNHIPYLDSVDDNSPLLVATWELSAPLPVG